MRKLIPALLITLFFSGISAAQTTFEVPQKVVLESDSDYPKYNNDIINAAKWLEETDLNKETAKRKEVNAFVIKWISGTPDISVAITESLTKLFGENNELMVVYLASYSKEFLENKNATDATATKAALISIIKVYKKGIAITKNKDMDKAVKAYDENKLDKYMADKL